nr:type I pullulanase [Bacillus sp. FJAT-47783]
MLSVKREFEAYLDDVNIVTILWPKESYHGQEKAFHLCLEDVTFPLDILENYAIERYQKFILKLKSPVEFGKTYYIQDETGLKTDLQIGAVIRTLFFDEQFYYDGEDLGLQFFHDYIICKVWAPSATHIKLKLTQPDTMDVLEIPLTREEKGVWSVKVDGQFEGYYYTYLVCVNLIWNEVVDPYAKAVSVNGEYGVVIDLEKTKVEKIDTRPLNQATDAIIYELHIRDFSIHEKSGMTHKGKYLALTEANTKTEDGYSSGISYLKELGITHVEILPFNDFEGVDELNPMLSYNWGYNPLHYNVPEGSYATNPKDPYSRIIELKKMIQALHQYGLKVIMDVVYNHVYIREESSFEKLVPGYFFRHDQYGIPSNGTGVGNDMASERKMVRKFILDSIQFWLDEYDVDGFRFDLMGILDIDTMNIIHEETIKRKKDAIILGEGWDLQTSLPYNQKATIANAVNMPGLSFFNDHFRDTVKGSTFVLQEKGFTLGNNHKISGIMESVTGCIPFNPHLRGLFQHPVQSVNYVESHDNHTFWDKMSISLDDEDEAIRRKRQRLALTIVLLSQGIPFLHSGQEFYRTKKGEENSYNLPDTINQIDWIHRKKYAHDIEYIQQIISLRKLHGAFRFPTAELVKKHCTFVETHDGVVAYRLHDVGEHGPWNDIFVIFKNHQKESTLFLENNDEWLVICTPDECSPFAPLTTVCEYISLHSIGAYVLYRK